MRYTWWALVALATLGCDPNLAADCAGPGDCPLDERCMLRAGVCVPKDNKDALNGDGAATDGATGGSDGSHGDASVSPPDAGTDSAPDAENHPDSSPEDIGVDMRLPVPDGQPVDAVVPPADANPDSASADVWVNVDATPDTGSDAAGGTGGDGGNGGTGGQGGTGGTPCVPGPETCDGLDNDCDGQTDEDFGLGGGCRSGLGVCEGPGFWRCGEDGERFCDLLVPVQPQDEVCDNADNDCNGDVDLVDGLSITESCYSDSPDTMGVGQCRGGNRTCEDGRFSACVGEVTPIAEACNGLDDDCDGDVDEDILGVGVPCDTGDPGICRNGMIECLPGGLDCVGAKGPGAQPETCNGADDDCDGQIDEADPATGFVCACTPGMESPCYDGPPGTADRGECQAGVKVCEDALGGYSECVEQIGPTPETCNGLDDDCDGVADDGLGLGQACFVGTGACRTEGVVECDPNGGTRCSAQAGNGLVETCNGLDDDCDGNIDEAGDNTPLEQPCYSGLAGTQGVGLCRPGTQTCIDGSFGSCVGEVGPRAEECNGVDEDCDGTTDNGFAIHVPCSAGQGACLTQGQQVCSGDGLSTTCNAVAGSPSDEVCDAVDNDCDGEIDEGVTNACGRCGPLPLEQCNGLDDDCDGQVDEQAQTGGEGVRCAPPGQFQMGSPDGEPGRVAEREAQHPVRITRTLLVSQAETTQASWEALGLANPSGHRCASCPVEQVNWFEAVAYANALSQAVGGLEVCYTNPAGAAYSFEDAAARIEPLWPNGLDCLGWRLPTEAEWEYVARGGTQTPWWCGNNPVCLANTDWVRPTPQGVPQPTCSKIQNNPWGLCDVHGNVVEWVWDWFVPDYGGGFAGGQELVDPLGPGASPTGERVYKGGHIDALPAEARSAWRSRGGPQERWNQAGFGLVRTILPPQ